ncbi:hypothetical protein HCN44_002604 [Aphidius gifuensis]|uniref:MH2 domain-containing protein n=1 Tax=Aphidius gifuensis TaxID=684658 RepID=A0A834Y0I2_APHGI|nr:hypothetical protein HCN44_002604 [Aphidius gifuensis]
MNIDKIAIKINCFINKYLKSSNKVTAVDEEKKKEQNISVLISNPRIKLISELHGNNCTVKRPNNWLSIIYFEQYRRLDEFISNECKIIVNNSCEPSNLKKFCIGSVKNKCQIQQFKVGRKYIGNGIQLHFDGYDVKVSNLSKTNIFVHPFGLNLYHNKSHKKIYRVPPRSSLLIYSDLCFQQLLSQYLKNGHEDPRILENTCKIRISFTLGWGEGHLYNDITTLPCWLELKLHSPIEILNTVLGPSTTRPSPVIFR